MYSPINPQLFATVYGGAAAAFGASVPTGPGNSANYIQQLQAAIAFAEAVDTAWNNSSNNAYDFAAISNAAALSLRDRGPFPNLGPFTDPNNWTKEAGALVAAILEGDAIAVANGISLPQLQISSLTAMAQSAWQIDPINGSSKNTGLPGSPVQIFGDIINKWGTKFPTLPNTTTFQFLNSETASQEQIDFTPTMGNGASFLLLGNYVQQGLPTTIATLLAKNRNLGSTQLLTITLTAPPAGLKAGWRINNITRASRAVIILNTAGTLTMAQPFVAQTIGTAITPPAEIDTWAITDTVIVEAPIDINLRNLKVYGSQGFATAGIIQGLNFLDQSGSGASAFTIECDGAPIRILDCNFQGKGIVNAASTSGGDLFLIDTYAPKQITFGLSGLIGGYVQTYVAASVAGTSLIDGDVVIGNLIGSCASNIRIGFAYFAFGGAVNHPIAASPLKLGAQPIFYGGTVWWGENVGGNSLFVTGGGQVAMRSTLNFVDVFQFNGSITIAGLGTASAYNPGTGVWTPGINITPTNLDANNALIDPASGSSIARTFE